MLHRKRYIQIPSANEDKLEHEITLKVSTSLLTLGEKQVDSGKITFPSSLTSCM